METEEFDADTAAAELVELAHGRGFGVEQIGERRWHFDRGGYRVVATMACRRDVAMCVEALLDCGRPQADAAELEAFELRWGLRS